MTQFAVRRPGSKLDLDDQRRLDPNNPNLFGLAERDEEFKLPTGRGDEFAHGAGSDPRDKPEPVIVPRHVRA
ncbi:hypothetical protein HNR29_006525 [Rhizobium leguminosarum]|nr:hypothetical protein [Rhizobium leguminosarum]